MITEKQILIPFIAIFFLLLSCGTTTEVVENKPMDPVLENGHQIIEAQIVEVSMVMKNAKVSSHTDLYVRRNVQDYFIKFCDATISRKEVEQALTMVDGISQFIKMEVEIRDGLWDSCDPEAMVQSRSGKYMVIYRIISE